MSRSEPLGTPMSHWEESVRCRARHSPGSPRSSISWSTLATALATLLATAPAIAVAEESVTELLAGSRTDVARTMGLAQGDCKKCHPSEVVAWMKSTHFLSAGLRLEKYSENTEKYAKALNIGRHELMSTSECADCHGTKAIVDNRVQVISGVSCEKCHGAAGGFDGWLNRHQSYHASRVVPRIEETSAHKEARLADCESVGMVRSTAIANLARACYSCHIVGNEKLVASGHKLASTFEFVSWSEGEVRHNFLLNRYHNAESPSLWLEETGNTTANRRRLKFVIGALVQLEVGLKNRATMTSAAQIPQLGGMIAAANGKLLQINGVAATDEVTKAGAIVTPLLGRMFAGLPDDESIYTRAASRVKDLVDQFESNHDGSDFEGLDALISATPAHFSQQFRDKVLNSGER